MTAIDAMLRPLANCTVVLDQGVGQRRAAPATAPCGHVLGSYDGASPLEPWAHYLLSHQLAQPWDVTPEDFWPPLSLTAERFVFRARDSPACTNVTAASACTHTFIKPLNRTSHLFELPAAPTNANLTYTPTLITVYPVCASGWVVLGEVSKLAAASHKRFSSIACTGNGVHVTVVGAVNETVPVTVLAPAPGLGSAALVEVHAVVLSTSGRGSLVLP
jgi:hypothetical protein